MRQVGIETSNLYTAFLALAVKLLAPSGELIAIIPRSFCNGPYFRPFRQQLLSNMSLRRLHIFESRQESFRDDAVLQENVIISAVKCMNHDGKVIISSSTHAEDETLSWREVANEEVVHPNDPQVFIHIVGDGMGQRVAVSMTRFQMRLHDLDLRVSTGRVVDFRVAEFLRREPEQGAVPLIYPMHLGEEGVVWPKQGRKSNAIVRAEQTEALLVPSGNYVLVKRFTSKEERRRVVARVFRPEDVPSEYVGFENHLNYIHCSGRGLNLSLANGLAAYLNSGLVDEYVRQFSGHTQINATDLRSLHYPSMEKLHELGDWVERAKPTQQQLDEFIAKRLLDAQEQWDPIQAKQRITEVEQVLKALGLPKAQQNERSALTLLALLDLRPEIPWSAASNPLCGITQMMDFFRDYYGKDYKPNTRETVRRQTVHQFRDAGLIIDNPDQPERPINSPNWVYQIEESALGLLRSFGTPEWEHNLRSYLASVQTLKAR